MNKIKQYFQPLYRDYLLNYIVTIIPCLTFRLLFLKVCGAKIGRRSRIDMSSYFLCPEKLCIGNRNHINRHCTIDARGGIIIKENVSISHNVTLCSAGHDCQTPDFKYISAPIIIEDYVWIGINVTILKGVTIGRGAVIAAGSVVTKDCESLGIYAGIPAKKIGERKDCMEYKLGKVLYKNDKYRKPYFR